MPYNPDNPVINLWEAPYNINHTKNRLLGVAFASYAAARTAYPYFIGWCEWAGYNQSQVLAMDEFSTAVNDAFWKTNTVMTNLNWPGPLPASTYAAGPTGKGRVNLPAGRWNTTIPLLVHPSGTLYADMKRPYYTNGYPYTTLATVIAPNRTGWVGPPANPSAVFAPFAAEYARVDGIRTANWGGYGPGWCEGLSIQNIMVVGGLRQNPNPGFRSSSYVGTGIAVWDAGETSELSNCFIEECNDYGIEMVYGTPGTMYNNSTFRNGITGHMITGGGSGHSVHRIYGPSGDDNGNALIGTRAGYGYQGGGNIIVYGAKAESLGGASYSAVTGQGIPGKGQLLFNAEDDGQVLNLSIFGAGTKNLNCAIDSVIRIGRPATGTRSTVNVQNLYVYGGNAVKHILQAGGVRYPIAAGNGYMAHSFVYTSNPGVDGGLFNSLNGFNVVPATSGCRDRLAWLPWSEAGQAIVPPNAWNYSTCTPSWNTTTGVGGSVPPPLPAVLTIISVAINPTSVTTPSTAQATAVPYDQYGNALTPSGTWSVVSGPGTISAGGLITPSAAGTVRVRYTQAGVTGEADLTVLANVPVPPVATSVSVTISPTSGLVGVTAQATAVVRDQNNNIIANAGVWTLVSGPGSINASGVITSTAAGPITVRYQQGGASGIAIYTATSVTQVPTTANVTVSPTSVIESQSAVASVVVLDQFGTPMVLAGTWSIVSGPATISVSGLVTTTGGAGTVTIRYTQGAAVGNTTLTVTAQPPPPPPPSQIPTTVTVSLSPASVVEGGGSQAIVTVRDQNGSVITGVAGTWEITSGSATISASTGAIATTAAGPVTVKFTVQQNGIFDTAVLNVTAIAPPPPAPAVPSTIAVSVSPISVQNGLLSQASAVIRDQYGVITSASVVWGVVSGPGAINTSGLITTSGTGNVIVRGTVSGYPAVTATATLQVTSVPPPPPSSGLLYSVVFAGKDVMALPGCTPVPPSETYRAGQIAGAYYSTKRGTDEHRNTRQVFSTPIAGVRRIVLKGATVKEGVSGRALNSQVVTNTLKQFVSTGTSSPIIGSFVVNVGPVDITIDFGGLRTISTLFGANPAPATPNTLWVEMAGLELWSTP